MARRIADAALKVTAALPNAANTTSTNAIDLGAIVPYPITEKVTVKLSNTAATGANSKNINMRLMESAESNANFTNVAEFAIPVLKVTDSSGYPAASIELTLQPSAKRYLKAAALGEANGGDASDGTMSLEIMT